jgi:hypothetical protein
MYHMHHITICLVAIRHCLVALESMQPASCMPHPAEYRLTDNTAVTSYDGAE